MVNRLRDEEDDDDLCVFSFKKMAEITLVSPWSVLSLSVFCCAAKSNRAKRALKKHAQTHTDGRNSNTTTLHTKVTHTRAKELGHRQAKLSHTRKRSWCKWLVYTHKSHLHLYMYYLYRYRDLASHRERPNNIIYWSLSGNSRI